MSDPGIEFGLMVVRLRIWYHQTISAQVLKESDMFTRPIPHIHAHTQGLCIDVLGPSTWISGINNSQRSICMWIEYGLVRVRVITITVRVKVRVKVRARASVQS